jgi:hypothetical protein
VRGSIAAKAAVRSAGLYGAAKSRALSKPARSAADELDDFQAVAVFDYGLRPTITRHDFAVEFHSDAVGLHIKGFDQRRECELSVRFGIRKGALFSVDMDFHLC